jgi:predicted nucleic acid-binding protein
VSREIFVDSGAWIALSDTRDKYHEAAKGQFRTLVKERINLVTTNLIIAEVYTIIRRTGGYDPAMRFLRSTRESVRLKVIFSDWNLEDQAEEILRKYKDQDFSLVDAVSFAVMQGHEIEEAFAFDWHFTVAGFRLIP